MQRPGAPTRIVYAHAGGLCRALRFGLIGALWAAASASADEPAARDMAPVQLGPNSYVVEGASPAGSAPDRGLSSNAGFVVTANSVVVVDALGSPPLAARLLEAIRRITPKPVSHVLVTRFHAGHVGGLPALKAAGATIVAHRPGQPAVQADADSPRLPVDGSGAAPGGDEGMKFLPADLGLDDSADLLIGGVHIQAQALGPTHSAQDMAYFLPEEGLLFVGDLVTPGRIPEVGKADTRRWVAALDELLALDARVLVPGQGPPSNQPVVELSLARDYLAFLRQTMAEALRQAEPFDAAYDKVDWRAFAHLPMFDSLNRANAHNTYLRMQTQSD